MSNADLMRRFYDGVNAGRMEVIDELIADDLVDHDEFPGIPPGKEGARQFFAMMRQAFPDLRLDVEMVVETGDIAASYVIMRGHHEGEFMGIAPTHREISIPAADFVRVRDGRAVEHWGATDTGMLMQQLGAMEAPAAPA